MTTNTYMRWKLFRDWRFRKIVEAEWAALTVRFPGVVLEAWTVQPDHMHGLIILTNHPDRPSIPDIVRVLKTNSARKINLLRRTPGKRVWQERYHDRIVRNRAAFERIRSYIINNTKIHQARRRHGTEGRRFASRGSRRPSPFTRPGRASE